MFDEADVVEIMERVHEQLNFIYSKEDYGEGVDQSILYPPATDEEIVALEEQTGFRFPPSYRRFLRLHNGWVHFWFNMTLTGVSGAHTQKLLNKFYETIEWQNTDLKEEIGELTPEEIKAWEQQHDRHFYLKNNWCLATNFFGQFYIFDKTTIRSDGEMQIIYWGIGWGAYQDDQYEDFPALLRVIAAEVEQVYKKLKRREARKKKR